MFSYDPLWKLLIDKKMNKSQLAEKCNLTRNTLAKMGKQEYIDLHSIDKICTALQCDVQDIIKHIK